MKILCVGQNYPKHVAELAGAAGAPTTPSGRPVWFWKPDTAIIGHGDAVRIPTDIGAVHHEVELAVRVGQDPSTVDAFTVAVDVTARDMQRADKEAGRPWQQAKGYDTFLPLGPWIDARGVDLQDLRLRLFVDDALRQDGSTADMTWPVDALLRHAAQWVTLRPGDILLTGTPHGVGPIQLGQTMRAEIVGHARMENPIEAR